MVSTLAGAELAGCQGGPLTPQNFAWPPSSPHKVFRVTSCHWSRSLSESPTQTIDSSPCCKTGPSSGPSKWKCLAPPLHISLCYTQYCVTYWLCKPLFCRKKTIHLLTCLTGSGYSELSTFECSGHIFCKWFVNSIKDDSNSQHCKNNSH